MRLLQTSALIGLGLALLALIIGRSRVIEFLAPRL